MNIAIATLTASAFGLRFEVDPSSTLMSHARRSSRMATLDGGAAMIDNGYTPADETVTVVFPKTMSQAEHELIRLMLTLYSRVILMLEQGAYLAHPKRITTDSIVFELLGIGEIQ